MKDKEKRRKQKSQISIKKKKSEGRERRKRMDIWKGEDHCFFFSCIRMWDEDARKSTSKPEYSRTPERTSCV